MTNELTHTARPLHVFDVEHEPRIRDLDLADRLGFERPRVIRELIYRNKAELETYGGLPYRTANLGAKGGRPTTECWLNEGQAILVCMFSQTAAAAAVRKQVIEAYQAWRRKTVPVKQHMRRPPAHPARLWTPDSGAQGFQITQYDEGAARGLMRVQGTLPTHLALKIVRLIAAEADNKGVFA